MLDNYSTNATIAKIHAIHGKMLTKENYYEMINKHSVSELAEYLKRNYRFKETLCDIDPSSIHRGLLEELLKKNNFDIYVRLCNFQRLDSKPFYNFLVQKIEIEQIIEAVNRINNQYPDDSLANVPAYVKKHSKINLLELRSSKNMDELKKSLKGTIYFKIVSSFDTNDGTAIDYVQFEKTLITFYYERLIENIKSDFFKSETEQLKNIIFTEIDLINIRNAYRKKVFFNYDSERIKSTQIPFTKIGKNKMNAFYEKNSAEEMLDYLKKTKYGRNIPNNTDYVEVFLQTTFSNYLKHLVAKSTSPPVVIYAFMKLCDIEVKNIIHIIEGIRYNVAPETIKKNLIVY